MSIAASTEILPDVWKGTEIALLGPVREPSPSLKSFISRRS
jgi:hypothetical protein